MIHFALSSCKTLLTEKWHTEQKKKNQLQKLHLQQRAGVPLRVSLHVKNMELAACAREGGGGAFKWHFLSSADTFHLETWQLLVCQSTGRLASEARRKRRHFPSNYKCWWMLAQRAARAEASPGIAKTNHRTLCKGAWHQKPRGPLFQSKNGQKRRGGGGWGLIFFL